MGKDDDAKFAALLNARFTPEVPKGLVEQIIARAHGESRLSTRIANLPKRPWYADFTQAFLIPRPAYALGVFLACGLLIGYTLPIRDDNGVPGDWQVTLSNSEAWL